MIFCVVPEALAEALFAKLTAYYADDDNVQVMVERRESQRRGPPASPSADRRQREIRDRRRARVPGEFLELDRPVTGPSRGE